jgi:hypothetical protein
VTEPAVVDPSAPSSASTSASAASVDAAARDRFVRPDAYWYALLEPGLVSLAVFTLSPGAYRTAKRLRLPLPSRRTVTVLFAGAVAVHAAEAAQAYRTATAAGLTRSAPRWAAETFVVGFPSLLKLREVIDGA